eukprot:TRINITY_DN13654_c0_g1_i1.p1 TRINITY_DN13654_c0_g1~~TRINITY_DN13654_c0_g1_i1.p1  ORF type:complete len:166 (-),score=23.85 TRINITY_DN13654_c0_g1_i1:135-632(-)
MGLFPDRVRAVLIKVFVAFAAGSFGGFCIGVFVPLAAQLGLPALLGVAIHPQLTKEFLYSKIVWGGLWGPIMLTPVFDSSVLKGLLLGAAGPALVQLFIVFPFKETPGSIAGLSLGLLTPVLVLFFNAVIWGIPTATLYHSLSTPFSPSYISLGVPEDEEEQRAA